MQDSGCELARTPLLLRAVPGELESALATKKGGGSVGRCWQILRACLTLLGPCTRYSPNQPLLVQPEILHKYSRALEVAPLVADKVRCTPHHLGKGRTRLGKWGKEEKPYVGREQGPSPSLG
jgi:hypothetical protein